MFAPVSTANVLTCGVDRRIPITPPASVPASPARELERTSLPGTQTACRISRDNRPVAAPTFRAGTRIGSGGSVREELSIVEFVVVAETLYRVMTRYQLTAGCVMQGCNGGGKKSKLKA